MDKLLKPYNQYRGKWISSSNNPGKWYYVIKFRSISSIAKKKFISFFVANSDWDTPGGVSFQADKVEIHTPSRRDYRQVVKICFIKSDLVWDPISGAYVHEEDLVR